MAANKKRRQKPRFSTGRGAFTSTKLTTAQSKDIRQAYHLAFRGGYHPRQTGQQFGS